jgi:hypothetical protein
MTRLPIALVNRVTSGKINLSQKTGEFKSHQIRAKNSEKFPKKESRALRIKTTEFIYNLNPMFDSHR